VSHWAPVPLAVNDDPRVRLRSPVEQLALVRLYLIARGADLVAMPTCAEAPYAVWRRLWGAEMADAVGALVEAALVAVEPAGLRLTISTGLRAAAAPGRPVEAASAASSEAAGAVAKLRALFSKHKLRSAADRDAWLKTDHGRRSIERLGITEAEAAEVVARTGSAPGRFGNSRTAVTAGVTVSNRNRIDGDNLSVTAAVTSLPSHTLPSEKEERKEDVTAREAAVTDGSNRNSRTAVTDGSNPVTERGSFATLQERAAPVADLFGGGEVDASALLVRMAVTAAEVDAMAAALARPSEWWPDRRRVPERTTLNDLLGFRGADGYDARGLTALVAHVRARKAAKAAPVASVDDAPVRLPRARKALPPEEQAAVRAQLNAVRASVLRPLSQQEQPRA